MRRTMRSAALLVLTVGLAAACSDDGDPGGDGSVRDGAARACSEELFCSNNVVEQELAGDAGRCVRRRVYTCKEGCKVFSASTTQPALLCNEDPPDSGPRPDRGADAGPPDDAAGDVRPTDGAAADQARDGAADLARDLPPTDLAADGLVADAA